MSNQYFASQDGVKAAETLLQKADKWNISILSTGYLDKLRSMYAAYHGFFYDSDGHQISFGGEQGELVQLPVNQIRNLASHMITMTCSSRPAMDARAVNTDYKSIVQTKLANGILEYYLREKRLEKYLKTAVEHAVVFGAGFVKMEWNATAGQIYDYLTDETTGEPDPKRPVYEGDLQFSNVSVFDVVVDNTKEDAHDLDWILVRTFKNKYDLAAKYPEFGDRITGLQTKAEMQNFRFGITNASNETDDVPVYEFYHKATECLPNGRYMLFLDDQIILQDIGMPYRVIPIFRISAGDFLGTPYGYTPLFDILPLQDAMNTLYSTIMTNQNATGVQTFWSKPGNNLNHVALGAGLAMVESMEKPEVLELCSTPKEVFDFVQMLERLAETLSGINSVARGNPESSLKTGAALALVQSQAIQFMSGLQQSYVELIEDTGGAIISILQDYAAAPRMIAIVGKDQRTKLQEFSGNDVANITRVYVDVGNPLARTIAGRMELASQMMQYMGNQMTPQQVLQVAQTGKLELLTDESSNELDLIKNENEALMDGESPPVIAFDDHATHIFEHRKVLQDTALRKDAELVARVTAHVQEHLNQLRTVDPQLISLIRQQPLPPPPPPAPPPGGPPQGPGNIPQGPQAQPPQGQIGMQMQPDQSGHQQVQGPGIPNGVNVPNVPKPPQIQGQ